MSEYAIIRLLRSLLSDLNYSYSDQADYLRRKGYCPECYQSLKGGCSCGEHGDPPSSEDEDEMDEEPVTQSTAHSP